MCEDCKCEEEKTNKIICQSEDCGEEIEKELVLINGRFYCVKCAEKLFTAEERGQAKRLYIA